MLFPKSNEQVLLFLGEEWKYDDKEVAHEKSSDTRLVFDGDFVLAFGHNGNGPGELSRPLHLWVTSNDEIFVADAGNTKLTHFNTDGNLVRKIRKEYKPIKINEDDKKRALERLNEFQRQYTYFPETYPPCRSLFPDSQGRLFVVTYEPGDNPGENMVDVFNSEGAFFGRVSWNILQGNTPITALIKSGRLYCGDCHGYQGRIPDLARDLRKELWYSAPKTK